LFVSRQPSTKRKIPIIAIVGTFIIFGMGARIRT
jgi:hypothetical protein